MLALSALITSVSVNNATAAVSLQVGTPNLNFSINDYQPAPPNVYVHNNSGRPYYVERDRRVYMEKRKPGKHYKYDKKHHEDRGRGEGHGNRGKHDR